MSPTQQQSCGQPEADVRAEAVPRLSQPDRRSRALGWKVAAIFLVPLLMTGIVGLVAILLMREAAALASSVGAPAVIARQLDGAQQIVRLGVVVSAAAILLTAWLMSTGLTASIRRLLFAQELTGRGLRGSRGEASGIGQLRGPAAQFTTGQAVAGAPTNTEPSIRIRQLVLENLADGVVVVDHHGWLVFRNRAAEEILGPEPAKVPFSRWAEWYGMYLADRKTLCDLETMPLVLAMEGRAARDLDLYISNPRVGGPKRVRAAVTPIADEEGGLWGGVVVLNDITRHQRAEEALRESEEKFRSFVETTYEWIWSIDAQGSLTYSNPAVERILGYRAGELEGRDIADLVHPQDRAQFLGWLEGFGQEDGPGVLRVVLRWMHKQGTERWLDSNAVPIHDSHGRVAGHRGTSRDITLQQMAEDEVQKLTHELRNRVNQLDVANRELETFSYSVSHDLRTPLRSIDGFSQALIEDYGGVLDEAGRDHLHRVRAASQRMAQLIDDLLKLSHVAREAPERSEVDLSALAVTIAAALREDQPGRKAEFVIAPGLAANADPRLLQIVMENLLQNAWKFTRSAPEARIEVGMTEDNGERAYFVRDNGVGFDMQYAAKLFGAFQRLHAMGEFEGTGVGLATVQRIIHRHGGRVWARAAVNQGATFYFTLG